MPKGVSSNKRIGEKYAVTPWYKITVKQESCYRAIRTAIAKAIAEAEAKAEDLNDQDLGFLLAEIDRLKSLVLAKKPLTSSTD